MVINEDEIARIFEECHSADFSGHAGRYNTIKKIRERYYWPQRFISNENVPSLNYNPLMLSMSYIRHHVNYGQTFY